jgi:hypothetical protein
MISFKEYFLLESPEYIDGVYDRTMYDFIYFIGDSEGVFLAPYNTGRESHSYVFRELRQRGIINKNYNVVYPIENNDDIEVLGNPQKIDFNYSGVILPKQEDIDSTYISYWTKESFLKLNDIILPYVKKNMPSPYAMEYVKKEIQLDDDGPKTEVIRIK